MFAGDRSRYFHQYEIVVTFHWTLQAIFMHMKAMIYGTRR
jgi:hypothetical protein